MEKAGLPAPAQNTRETSSATRAHVHRKPEGILARQRIDGKGGWRVPNLVYMVTMYNAYHE